MDFDFERRSAEGVYSIDWNKRLILTQYGDNPEIVVDFNAAFAKAVDCLIALEDGKWPNGPENLYLAVYQRYLARGQVAPENLYTPEWARFD